MPQNILECVHAELYEENTRDGEYKVQLLNCPTQT